MVIPMPVGMRMRGPVMRVRVDVNEIMRRQERGISQDVVRRP